MARKSNRAFTLVELIIVIAVIGVLAAILIPVFSNVVKKANIADKTSLARNLNTQIAAENEGTARVATMGEAMAIAHKTGYTDDQIFNTQTAGTIVFNAATGNFAVVENVESGTATFAYSGNNDKTAPASTLFSAVEVSRVNDPCDFGMYLYEENESGREYNFTVSNSVDTGSLNVNTITFSSSNAGPFTISGNCETLNVDAPNAVVNHYGYANHVVVTAVATESYHEFGVVGVIDIVAGHLVIEAGASVLTGVNVLDLDHVTVALFAEAVIFGGTESQLQAIVNQENDGNPTIQWTTSGEQLETIGFASGSGTEADPYIIRTRKQFENITSLYSDDANATHYFFKVDPEVKEINAANWGTVKLNGSIDGSGVTMNNLSAALFRLWWANDSVTPYIKNFTINANIVGTSYEAALVRTAPIGASIIENVTVHGYIEGGEVGGYVAFGPNNHGYGDSLYFPTFKNCVNDATLVATTGAASGFIHHPYCKYAVKGGANNSTLTLINSKYCGKMAATSASNKMNYFASGGRMVLVTEYTDAFAADVVGVLYKDPATITYSASGWFTADHSLMCGNSTTINPYLPAAMKTVISVSNESLTGVEYGDALSVAVVSGAHHATATLIAAPNSAETGTGSYQAFFMVENLNAADGKFTTENIKLFHITVNGHTTSKTGVTADGKTFNIEDDWYKTETLPGTVKVVQYDAQGNILKINKFAIPNG